MILMIDGKTFEINTDLPCGEHYVEMGSSGEIKEINGEDEGWFITGLPILKLKRGKGVYVENYDELIAYLEQSSFWCVELTDGDRYEAA